MDYETNRTYEEQTEQLNEKKDINWDFEIAPFCAIERRRRMNGNLREILKERRLKEVVNESKNF